MPYHRRVHRSSKILLYCKECPFQIISANIPCAKRLRERLQLKQSKKSWQVSKLADVAGGVLNDKFCDRII